MKVQEQIKAYITSQPEPKRSDMQALHRIILDIMPACKLWFLDGKNSENKTVSNKFKTLKDVNMEILEAVIRYGFEAKF